MKMFLNGEWVDREERIEVVNPYDGEVVDSVPSASPEDLEMAVKSAKEGFKELKKLSAYDKYKILSCAAKLLENNSEDFARELVLEVGKTIKEARGEVARAIQTLYLSAEEAKRLKGEQVIFDADPRGKGKFGMYIRVPIGPIGAITPFNFPLNLALHKLGPAFAVGNSVVHKPASATPLTNLKFTEILLESGLPRKAINVITGPGGTIGEGLVKHPELKMITFTGSRDVGLRIMDIKGYKKALMELGSNAPMIVTETADVEKAAKKAVVGAFAQAGQSCISLQRVFVHKKIFDLFLSELVNGVKNIKVGDPMDEETGMGPLINEGALNRVKSWIEEAVEHGAEIVYGGNVLGKTLMEPTVLINVPEDVKLFQDEVFGPVVFVNPYENFEDAVKSANNSKYGLNAAIFTRDLNQAIKGFLELEFGGILINELPTWRVDLMPYGGMKESGFGREGPEFVVKEMSEIKMLGIDLS